MIIEAKNISVIRKSKYILKDVAGVLKNVSIGLF
jgi:hypothetical protein